MILIFFAYIDESGNSVATGTSYFMLTTLLVQDKYWKEINSSFKKVKMKIWKDVLKKKKFPKVKDKFDLHLSDILTRRNKQDSFYNDLSVEERIEILNRIYSFFTTDLIRNSQMKIISVIYLKNPKDSLDSSLRPRKICLENLMERIEQEIKYNFPEHYAILRFDGKEEMKDKKNSDVYDYYDIYKRTINFGTNYVKEFKHITEDLSFVQSKHNNFIQLADCICGLLYHYLTYFITIPKNPSIMDENIDDFIQKIKYLFRGYPDNIKGRGIKVFNEDYLLDEFWNF